MFGTVVEFVPATDVEVHLAPSKVGRKECQVIGWSYFDAATRDGFGNEGGDVKDLDAMLDEFGPVLIRRSLRAFANYAKRTNQKDVADAALELRDEIKAVAHNAKTA